MMLLGADIKTLLLKPVVAQGLCLLFVILILWNIMSASTQYQAIQHPQSNSIQQPLTQSSTVAGHDEKILNLPLFGEYVPKQFGDLNNIKRSALNIRVVGIVYSPHDGESKIIIRTSEDDQQSYKIGDTIPGGVVIKQITPDGVLLSHDGELESLSLPKDELHFEAPPRELRHD